MLCLILCKHVYKYRYCAVILEKHIKDFCKQLYAELDRISNKKKYTKNDTTKAGEYHLGLLKKYFNKQISLWLHWKSLKKASKDKIVPTKIDNDYNDNDLDINSDHESDGDSDYDPHEDECKLDNNNSNNGNGNTKKGGSNLDIIRKICKNTKMEEQYYDNRFIIGWNKRIKDLDLFTTKLPDAKQYFKYSKCRESTLTVPRKKFYKWLNIKPYSKSLTQFVGFLLWDRIGYIIQISMFVIFILFCE